MFKKSNIVGGKKMAPSSRMLFVIRNNEALRVILEIELYEITDGKFMKYQWNG